MRIDLDGVAVFVKVVQAGSFTRAARLLGMPNTTVSAKVARLETRLRVKLIERTTRSLRVTPAGQAYYAGCTRGLEEIEAAQLTASRAAPVPNGTLRIAAPGDVARNLLAPIVLRYAEQYPETAVETIVAERLDLVGGRFDIAIRPGAPPDDPRLTVRPFLSVTGGLWASPAYLLEQGVPGTPGALEKHRCLLLSILSQQSIRLTDGEHEIAVALTPLITVDDVEMLRELALEGLGVAPLPDFVACDHARAGALVRVLPDWSWSSTTLSFVHAAQPSPSTNVSAFMGLAAAVEKERRCAPRLARRTGTIASA